MSTVEGVALGMSSVGMDVGSDSDVGGVAEGVSSVLESTPVESSPAVFVSFVMETSCLFLNSSHAIRFPSPILILSSSLTITKPPALALPKRRISLKVLKN